MSEAGSKDAPLPGEQKPLNGSPRPEEPPSAGERLHAAIAAYHAATAKAIMFIAPNGQPTANIDLVQMLVQSRVDRLQLQLLLTCMATGGGLDLEAFNQAFAASIEAHTAQLQSRPKILVPS